MKMKNVGSRFGGGWSGCEKWREPMMYWLVTGVYRFTPSYVLL
jgi:hypothetical protein